VFTLSWGGRSGGPTTRAARFCGPRLIAGEGCSGAEVEGANAGLADVLWLHWRLRWAGDGSAGWAGTNYPERFAVYVADGGAVEKDGGRSWQGAGEMAVFARGKARGGWDGQGHRDRHGAFWGAGRPLGPDSSSGTFGFLSAQGAGIEDRRKGDWGRKGA